MASVTDIGAVTNPLGGPFLGGPTGWAAAVRDALNSSDTTVDARIATHAGAADPHPGYLTPSEGNGLYEALGAVSTHAGASDPHTGYQREVEKAAANGYASLDGTTKVPYAQLPTGTAASTVAIGNHNHTGVYDPSGTAATAVSNHVALADPHTQYVEKNGDTLTGALVAAADPVVALGVATKQYVDAGMPLGSIIMYGGTAAPAGWHLCDGTAHGSTPLQTLLGSVNTPDLRGKFVVGVGDSPDASTPTVYARGDKGGAETVTLTAAESGTTAHGHGTSVATSLNNAAHSHGGLAANDGAHQHTYSSGNLTNDGYGLVGSAYHQGSVNVGNPDKTTYGGTGSHTHVIGTDNANHGHTFTPSTSTAAAASAAHENRPPYYALTYIIKKV